MINRFNEIGLACLDPRWAGGRPRLLSPDEEDFVVATAAIRPAKLGQPFTRWSYGAPVYVMLDNLSAHKGTKIRRWAEKHKMELCFTPTNASWADPIEVHFGPLRQFKGIRWSGSPCPAQPEQRVRAPRARS